MIVVCDQQEYKQLQGRSFVAEAIRQFDIRLEYIPLDEGQMIRVKNAMKNQNFYDGHNSV